MQSYPRIYAGDRLAGFARHKELTSRTRSKVDEFTPVIVRLSVSAGVAASPGPRHERRV